MSRRGTVVVVAVLAASVLAHTPVAAAQAGSGFEDVADGAYYGEPVAALAAGGVLEGTLCTEGFCPGEPIDRKTMAVWVVRVLDGADPPAVSQARFVDVDADGFHAPFVERMHQLGVTSGCGDGRGFCPHDNVTRAQMAAFLSRAFKLPAGGDPNFFDVPASAWYAAEVAKLAASGITRGCGDGRGFCPHDNVTRAQMATLLWRGQNLDSRQPAPGQYTAISVGDQNVCAIRTDTSIACWSLDASDPPPDCAQQQLPRTCTQSQPRGAVLDAPQGQFTAVSVGAAHACAIRTDRTAVCWGDNTGGQLEVPAGRYIAIDVDHFDTGCALRTGNTVVCWGRNGAERTEAINKQGRFTAVSVGSENVCGVRTDGSAVCVYDFSDHVSEREGAYGYKEPFAAIDTPDRSGCGLFVDGTAVCWYTGLRSRIDLRGEFVAISTSPDRFCGIRTDSTLHCTSIHRSAGPSGPVPSEFAPDGQYTDVSSGHNAACAVRTDGTAVCWGHLNHANLRDHLSQGALPLPAGVQVALPPPWDTDDIAAAEAEMARLVNELRGGLGLAPLAVHTRQSTQHTSLWTVARAWSLTMRDTDIFEHNPDFTSQYPNYPVRWTRAGENIAFNSASGRTIMDAVQTAFDALVASPGHYANMTNPEFNHVGIGIASQGSSFWFTQNFAHYQ